MEFPIKLKVVRSGEGYMWPYFIEEYHRGETVSFSMRKNIGDVEEQIAKGRVEMDLYDEMRQVGESIMLLQGLERMGFASYPELAEMFKKVDEDRWGDITDEEKSKAEEAWNDALKKEWFMTWTPADVEWSPEAAKDREIFHTKYSYDGLMALKVDEVKDIAKVKGVSTTGRKEEIARRIHQHDFGEEEVGETLERIDKLMTTIGDHRRVEPEVEEPPLPPQPDVLIVEAQSIVETEKKMEEKGYKLVSLKNQAEVEKWGAESLTYWELPAARNFIKSKLRPELYQIVTGFTNYYMIFERVREPELPPTPIATQEEEEAKARRAEEKPPKMEFTFRTSRGNEVKVSYDPGFMHGFEFRGSSISPTGYRSHFPLQDEDIENPEEFAKSKAEELEEEFFEETKKKLRRGKRGVEGLSTETQLEFIEGLIKNAEDAIKAGAVLTDREKQQIGELKGLRDVIRAQLGKPPAAVEAGVVEQKRLREF